jgi:hypothetical protein
MIEEYARHNGHADLIRECIDGAIDRAWLSPSDESPGSGDDQITCLPASLSGSRSHR